MRYLLAAAALLGFFVLFVTLPPFMFWFLNMVEAQTKVDVSRQGVNVPQTQQSTHLSTVFEPGKRVAPPGQANLPCAAGTWAATDTSLYFCLVERPTGYGWIRIAAERF